MSIWQGCCKDRLRVKTARLEVKDMLKITEIRSSGEGRVVRLEGELIGPWVTEAACYCEQILEAGVQLTLDVGEVCYLDHSGVSLLHRLLARRVSLQNCTPFIAELLKANGDSSIS